MSATWSSSPRQTRAASSNDLKQAILGVMAILVLALIVLGSLILSFVENPQLLAALPEQQMDIGQAAPSDAVVFRPEAEPPQAGPAQQAPNIPSNRSISYAESPSGSTCAAPAGWKLYLIQPDETLDVLAQRFDLSPAEFAARNCLDVIVSSLPAGSTVFVPAGGGDLIALVTAESGGEVNISRKSARLQVVARHKPEKCGPPSWWTVYRVQPGDTLYRLGMLSGASVAELQDANCLGNSTLIRAGQALYTPVLPVIAAAPPKHVRPTDSALDPPQPTQPSPYPTINPTITPVPTQPTEPPVETPPVEPPVQTPPVEPPVQTPPVEPPVQTPPVEPPVQTAPVEPPVQTPPVEPPVQTPPVEPPVQTQPVEPPVQPPPAEPPVPPPPAEPPVSSPPVGPPVQPPPAEPPVQPPPAEPPVQPPPSDPPAQPPAEPVDPDVQSMSDGFLHFLTLPWYDPFVRLAILTINIWIG